MSLTGVTELRKWNNRSINRLKPNRAECLCKRGHSCRLSENEGVAPSVGGVITILQSYHNIPALPAKRNSNIINRLFCPLPLASSRLCLSPPRSPHHTHARAFPRHLPTRTATSLPPPTPLSHTPPHPHNPPSNICSLAHTSSEGMDSRSRG